MEKKEKEKIDINKLYEEKLIKCYKMEANVKKNKDKLDRMGNVYGVAAKQKIQLKEKQIKM